VRNTSVIATTNIPRTSATFASCSKGMAFSFTD
jgi:hypothetical protein